MAHPAPASPSEPQPIQISPHLKLQPPLSRRGSGAGLILVLDHYAQLEASSKSLDPAPLTKWAEESYTVAQILVPGSITEDGEEFPLQAAIEALRGMKECDTKEGEGFGVILYLTHIPFYIEQSICLNPSIAAIISYGGKKVRPVSTESPIPPQLIHISGPPERSRKESFAVVVNSSENASPITDSVAESLPEPTIKTFRYLTAEKEAHWILPSDPSYHSASASLAHTRSLTFLKPLLNGPYFDLEAIWEEHCTYEFETRDVEATMATMVAQPYVNHIPVLTGGIGRENLTSFYRDHFIFANADDANMEVASRTVGIDKVVDEFVFEFTHDRTVDWLLPNVPPTNLPLRIPFTSVVNFRGDRLCHEHISWDQGTVLRQLGLLPEWMNFPHPVDGRKPAEGKKFEFKVPVVGVDTARKLVEESCVESNELLKGDGGKGWREVDA